MTGSISTVRTVADLRARVGEWRSRGERSALVPTMGALHEGHLSLVDVAKASAQRVVVSIFVNPKQFAPSEDFSTYPRDEQDDLAKLAARGADLAFVPGPEEMYPPDFSTSVAVSDLTEMLDGASRPHFFGGVATVVAKLLIQAQCDYAVFGEKDYQQLLVVRRMARDLDIPTEIIGAPIIREPDGLAMSSRNAYLDRNERQLAGQLNVALRRMAAAIAQGTEIDIALAEGRQSLRDAGFPDIDYLEVRDAERLEALSGRLDRPARLFIAVMLGKTRLIDNVAVGPDP